MMNTNFTILTCHADEITPTHLAAGNALWTQEWPPSSDHPVDPQAESTPVGYVLLLDSSGSVAGVCCWIERAISVASKTHRVAGLAGVVIEASLRGDGHGTRLVLAATAWAKSNGYHWAVLFCSESTRSFYERLGWHQLRGNIIITRFMERGTLSPGDIIMAQPLDEAARSQLPEWLDATVDAGSGQW